MMLMLSSGFERPYRGRETASAAATAETSGDPTTPTSGRRCRQRSMALPHPATAGHQRDLLLSIPDVDASAPIRTRPLIPSRRRCTKTALLSAEVSVHPDCREVTGRVHGLQRMTQGSSRIVDAPSGCRRIMPGLPQTLLRA
jgi:hypothetical protein